MTPELQRFLCPPGSQPSYPDHLSGRLVRFAKDGAYTQGRPDYGVYTQRGGWFMGRIEYRNQWNMFSFTPSATDIPYNKVMIAEIYALLKELDGRS